MARVLPSGDQARPRTGVVSACRTPSSVIRLAFSGSMREAGTAGARVGVPSLADPPDDGDGAPHPASSAAPTAPRKARRDIWLPYRRASRSCWLSARGPAKVFICLLSFKGWGVSRTSMLADRPYAGASGAPLAVQTLLELLNHPAAPGSQLTLIAHAAHECGVIAEGRLIGLHRPARVPLPLSPALFIEELLPGT